MPSNNRENKTPEENLDKMLKVKTSYVVHLNKTKHILKRAQTRHAIAVVTEVSNVIQRRFLNDILIFEKEIKDMESRIEWAIFKIHGFKNIIKTAEQKAILEACSRTETLPNNDKIKTLRHFPFKALNNLQLETQ